MTWGQILVFIMYSVILFFCTVFLVSQIWIDLSNSKLKNKFGLPYVPTGRKRLNKMLEFAELKEGDRVVDLGSGDGRLVIAAAKKGAYAEGFELNPVLVWWSRLKIKLAGVSDKAKVYRKDLFKADIAQYNVFMLYAMPWVMDEVQNKLKNTQYDNIKLVSNTFQFGNWKPTKSAEKEKVYLYEITKTELNKTA